jgi:hypothetical protein
MSLINDALKRAKNAQRENLPSSVSPLRPVETQRRERDFGWTLPVAVILLIVVAVFFIALSTTRPAAKNVLAVPVPIRSQAVETVAVPAPNPPALAASAPVTPPPVVISPAVINKQVPQPPRIQAIAYDLVNPWAIVSGKTVYVGDLVDGMRVTAISRNAVTLAGKGRTNQLAFGRQ